MFFINSIYKIRTINKLVAVLNSTYILKVNHNINGIQIPLYIPDKKIAINFGYYDKKDKDINKLEDSGITYFNIPLREDIFSVLNRLFYVLTKKTL